MSRHANLQPYQLFMGNQKKNPIHIINLNIILNIQALLQIYLKYFLGTKSRRKICLRCHLCQKLSRTFIKRQWRLC